MLQHQNKHLKVKYLGVGKKKPICGSRTLFWTPLWVYPGLWFHFWALFATPTFLVLIFWAPIFAHAICQSLSAAAGPHVAPDVGTKGVCRTNGVTVQAAVMGQEWVRQTSGSINISDGEWFGVSWEGQAWGDLNDLVSVSGTKPRENKLNLWTLPFIELVGMQPWHWVIFSRKNL